MKKNEAMAAKILIRDGNPWWLSQDIWVVPGNDPNGSKDSPIAGQQNYLWAKIHNVGNQYIEGAKINFYWSNPAVGLLRSNSTFIGSAFVDLEIGESKDVLCLTPWIPIVVNNGHECVIAEAITPLDPLPVPLPDDFDPPSFDQIAQRNLQVVVLSQAMQSAFLLIQISSSSRMKRIREITVEEAILDSEHERAILKEFGYEKFRKLKKGSIKFGISRQGGCHSSKEAIGKYNLKLNLEGNNVVATFVHLELSSKNMEKGYQLLNVTEKVNGKIVGGNSVLIIKK